MRIKKIIPRSILIKLHKVVSRLFYNRKLFHYGLLVKLQRLFLSKAWLQQLFFPRRIRLLKEWAQLCSSPEIPGTILESLMANTGAIWRSAALNQPGAFQHWVKIQGIENLENAVNLQRGVIILGTHSMARGLLRRVIRTMSSAELFLLGGGDAQRDQFYITASFAHQVANAQKLLRRGGIVHIAGEGIKGKAYLSLPFYGHMFPFRSGFAEMAVRTGAVILALFTYLEQDGRITFKFIELLPPSPGTRESQVEGLVRQYAQLLVEHWPRMFSSLRWPKLRQVLDMPAVTE